VAPRSELVEAFVWLPRRQLERPTERQSASLLHQP
jgi:hypothetical protein